MIKSCVNLRNLVLGPRALAMISCTVAMLATQPMMAVPAAAKVAKVQMLGQILAIELQSLERQQVTVTLPPYRVTANDGEVKLSRERKFAIEQHLLAPPAA